MAQRTSILLTILFVINPFVLLFYQNCSKAPQAHIQQIKKTEKIELSSKALSSKQNK